MGVSSQSPVLGLDLGGTQIRAVLADGEEILHSVAVPSPQRAPLHVKGQALGDVIDSVVSEFGIPAAIAVGSRGCDSEAQCTELADQLSERCATGLAVVNDAELLVPTAGAQNAVGLVAGTGSVAVGYSPDDDLLIEGGFGWLFGDDGSGAAIVREAARTLMRGYSDGLRDDILEEALITGFEVSDLRAVASAMERVRGASEWGRRCPYVFEAAEAGSPIAAEVIREGGELLAGLAHRISLRGAAVDQIILGGGVITNQPALRTAVEETLAVLLPESRVQTVTQAPVMGAVELARRIANDEPPFKYSCLRRVGNTRLPMDVE